MEVMKNSVIHIEHLFSASSKTTQRRSLLQHS